VVTPLDLFVSPGEVKLRNRPLGHVSASHRRVTVWTEIWAGGAFQGVLPTTFEVQVPERPAGALWIHRGESAVLTHAAGNVTVQTKAQALQDGVAGQTIQIKPSAANAVLHAQVVGRGQLELPK
jgi:hypothetical protein